MKNKLFIVAILFLWIFAGRNYLQQKFPYTHDGENHLARFANYKVAIREGQIPPRFAPNLVNHYGYPVFNYNYPLANIASLPFSFLKINYEVTFKIIALSSILFGLIGAYKWLKITTKSKRAMLFGLGIFAINPYLVNIVFYRGNIGELMALSMMPWLFYYSDFILKNLAKIKTKIFFKLIFLWSLFLLSHNIFAVFGSALILFYFTLNFLINNKSFKPLLKFFTSFLASLFTSLWFWLPAIFEKSEVVLDNAKFFQEYEQHFPAITQLLFSPFEFGFSRISSVDDLSFSLGFASIIVVIHCTLLVLKQIINKNFKIYNFSILVLTAVFLLFLQSHISSIVWQNTPLVSYIQFPWRLGMFFAVISIPISAIIFESLSNKWRFILVLMLVTQFMAQINLKSADYFHKNNIDYDAYTQTTSTLNENMPISFKYENFADWQPTPIILSGQANISFNENTNDFWSGSKRQYTIEVIEESIIVEPTAYFLGWESSVSGEKVEYIDNEEIAGRIAYKLDPGNYQVKSEFTQNTWPRQIGNFSSLVVIAIITTFYIKNHFSKDVE